MLRTSSGGTESGDKGLLCRTHVHTPRRLPALEPRFLGQAKHSSVRDDGELAGLRLHTQAWPAPALGQYARVPGAVRRRRSPPAGGAGGEAVCPAHVPGASETQRGSEWGGGGEGTWPQPAATAGPGSSPHHGAGKRTATASRGREGSGAPPGHLFTVTNFRLSPRALGSVKPNRTPSWRPWGLGPHPRGPEPPTEQSAP